MKVIEIDRWADSFPHQRVALKIRLNTLSITAWSWRAVNPSEPADAVIVDLASRMSSGVVVDFAEGLLLNVTGLYVSEPLREGHSAVGLNSFVVARSPLHRRG